MSSLALSRNQELNFGQGLRKISELARLIVALLGLTGFLVAFFAILYLLAFPISLAFVHFYGWVNRREQARIRIKLPSLSQKEKMRLCQQIKDDAQQLEVQIIKWGETDQNRGIISTYFYKRIRNIHEVGLETLRIVIASTYPNAAALGLTKEDSDSLRNSFRDFEEDWNREDMDEYDEMIAS